MNLTNLKSILEQLKKEIDPKLVGTKEQSLLIAAEEDVRMLINRLENPEKTKRLEKLAGY